MKRKKEEDAPQTGQKMLKTQDSNFAKACANWANSFNRRPLRKLRITWQHTGPSGFNEASATRTRLHSCDVGDLCADLAFFEFSTSPFDGFQISFGHLNDGFAKLHAGSRTSQLLFTKSTTMGQGAQQKASKGSQSLCFTRCQDTHEQAALLQSHNLMGGGNRVQCLPSVCLHYEICLKTIMQCNHAVLLIQIILITCLLFSVIC